jgi:hypothetical protein
MQFKLEFVKKINLISHLVRSETLLRSLTHTYTLDLAYILQLLFQFCF